jgi:hypothetical protein
VDCQSREYEHGQNMLRGYLYTGHDHARFYRDTAWSGLPLYVLSTLALHLEGRPAGAAFADAVRMLVGDYLLPISQRSPFGVLPFGLYRSALAGNAVSRPLAGALSFRYFNWREATSERTAAQETETFQHGLTSNQLGYAVGLMMAERVLRDGVSRNLALRQLEWVMGANPYAACLMTGAGANTPYPFSPFVGLIPGGMQNGFIGNAEDVPFLHPGNTLDWNTTEYWGTHNAHYLWALSLLYEGCGATI